ncbi:MAG TPA: amidohydrolase family protein [Chthonomonadaceae bacterium]|nr:amidohydrolase family protein [Chthonomonadaceae bacterium]
MLTWTQASAPAQQRSAASIVPPLVAAAASSPGHNTAITEDRTSAPQTADRRPLVIRAGRILTVTNGEIQHGVIVVRDGKIAAIGRQGEVQIPAGAEVIDAPDMTAMPGLIDLHTHIGNNSGLHDYVHSLNPAFHVWEYIDPDDSRIKDAIASGITTLNTIPGSGGNNSGFGVLWKLGGAPREDLIIRKLGVIKIAQAYNPERHAGDLGLSRMGMWWMLREQFSRAKEYTARMDAPGGPTAPAPGPGAHHAGLPSPGAGSRPDGSDARATVSAPRAAQSAGPAAVRLAALKAPSASSVLPRNPGLAARAQPAPERVLGMEQMRTVIEKKTPVFVHTAGARDVMGTMRMFHDELQLPVVISHGEFGGLQAASEAARRDIPCNIGPRFYDFSYQTYDRRFYSIPQAYVDAGVKNLSLNTDCPVIPGDDLFVQGTIAVRMGMDEDLALRALTINPARTIGIGDRVGSLEVGKDADIILKRGSLFDPRNPIEKVLINGRLVYTHGQRRHGAAAGPAAPTPETEDDGCSKAPEEESFLSHAR